MDTFGEITQFVESRNMIGEFMELRIMIGQR